MGVEKIYSGEKTSGFIVNNKWFLKVYHDTRFRKGIRNVILRSKPENEYFFSKLLIKKGIPTTKAVSYRVVKHLGIFPLNVGFVKFVCMNGLTPLDKLLGSSCFPKLFSDALKVIAQIHQLSIIHGDLAVSNFGVYEGKIFIFDLANTRRVPHPFFAHKEIFRLFHDLYKLTKETQDLYFDFKELFNHYLQEISLRPFLKRKLEREFLVYAFKRGMIRK